MPDLIDWYLVELRQYLDKRLPLDRIAAIVAEAESHLQESVKSRSGPIEESSRAAIETYDEPQKVAEAFFRKSDRRLFGLNPVWWVVACTVTCLWCWDFEWMTFGGAFDNFGETWQNGLIGLIGVASAVLLASAVRAGLRSYRVAIIGAVLGVALFSIPLMSFWIVPGTTRWQAISRFHLGRDMGLVQRSVARLDVVESILRRGMAAYATAKSPADLPEDIRDVTLASREIRIQSPPFDGKSSLYVLGRYGAIVLVDGRMSVFQAEERFHDAQAGWAENGSLALQATARESRDLSAFVSNAEAARQGRLFFRNPELCEFTVAVTVQTLPLLLLVDWIASLIATRRRRWIGTKLEVA